jgi:hypothetical protein
MPLSATEILAFAGTGSNFLVLGICADDGFSSQPPAWPAAGALDAGLPAATVVGPGVLDEHAASEKVAAIVAVAVSANFLSRRRRGVFVTSCSLSVKSGRG